MQKPENFPYFVGFNPCPHMLSEGDKAPTFTGTDQDGDTVRLEDYKGKKLVLYFYPKDDTPSCTNQACGLRDNIHLLRKKGYEVLGVSPDTEKAHRKFTEKYDLPFRLLSDPEHKVINAFGVWGRKKFMGRDIEGVHRVTFIIGENGVIERVIQVKRTKQHVAQVLEEN